MVVVEGGIVDRVYDRPISGSVPVQIDYSLSLLVYLVGYLVLIHHTDKCFSWPLGTVRSPLSSVGNNNNADHRHRGRTITTGRYLWIPRDTRPPWSRGSRQTWSRDDGPQMSAFRYVGHGGVDRTAYAEKPSETI